MRQHPTALYLVGGTAMYLTNKYTNWYYSIVYNAQNRISPNTYTEKHHIIPKSLGGSNHPSNIVVLTAREHFICHWLLTKMVTESNKRKMIYAWWAMANQKRPDQIRYKVSGRKYQRIKEQAINLHKSYKHSKATKQKLSKARKGLKFSKDWRDAISDGQKTRDPSTRYSPFREKKTCPHCNKNISIGNYQRWHGDNCTHKS